MKKSKFQQIVLWKLAESIVCKCKQIRIGKAIIQKHKMREVTIENMKIYYKYSVFGV